MAACFGEQQRLENCGFSQEVCQLDKATDLNGILVVLLHIWTRIPSINGLNWYAKDTLDEAMGYQVVAIQIIVECYSFVDCALMIWVFRVRQHEFNVANEVFVPLLSLISVIVLVGGLETYSFNTTRS